MPKPPRPQPWVRAGPRCLNEIHHYQAMVVQNAQTMILQWPTCYIPCPHERPTEKDATPPHSHPPPTPCPCHRQRYLWPTFSLTFAQTTAQADPAQIWDPTGGTTFPSTGEIPRPGGRKAHASGPVVNMVWRDCQQAASRRRETEGFGGRGGAAQKCAAPRTICPEIIRLYGSGFQIAGKCLEIGASQRSEDGGLPPKYIIST